MTNPRKGISQLHWSVLSTQLAGLRGEADGLAARFTNEYGAGDEATQRAEQLGAAIQRLEWALSRQQSRKMSAASGG
jgi:hypothetical protein